MGGHRENTHISSSIDHGAGALKLKGLVGDMSAAEAKQMGKEYGRFLATSCMHGQNSREMTPRHAHAQHDCAILRQVGAHDGQL